jgi:hypothetical protein
MQGHFRYLRFKTFPMTPRTPQCEVFRALLSSSKHSGVPEDSKSPTFPSVGLHPHTWPKWGCDNATSRALVYFPICLKCHLLHFALASFSSSPISIGSYSMSSSYNVALVLFLVATISQLICKVSNSTLPCATYNSFLNFFSFATRCFRSL